MSKKSKLKLLKHKDKLKKGLERNESTVSVTSDISKSVDNSEENMQNIKRCPHLKKMIKLKAITNVLNSRNLNTCDVCGNEKTEIKDIYMCLTCAKILCGSNDENHMENHFKVTDHCIFIHISSRTFYCFLCEEEIFYGKLINSNLEDVLKAFNNYENKKRMKEMIAIRKERLLSNAKKSLIYPGLKNLKHTCFFNSVMQCLTYTKPFEDIVNDKIKLEEGPLTNAFVAFLKTMHGKLQAAEEKQKNGEKLTLDIYTPKDLFDQIIVKWDQYKGFNQQDSHELLRHLLDGIRDEQVKAFKEKGEENKVTFIDELFKGKLVNYIVCDTCKIIKFIYEPFYDLSISMNEEKKSFSSFIKKKTEHKKNVLIGPDKSNIEQKFEGEVYPLVDDEKNKKNYESILKEIVIEKKESNEESIRDCIKQFMDIDTLEGDEACVCDNCTKIRYGKNNDSKKNKKSIKNKGSILSIKGHQNLDEDSTSISYYCALNGIKEDKESLQSFDDNISNSIEIIKVEDSNDNEEEEDNDDDDEEEEEEEEEKEKEKEKENGNSDEKKKVVYRRIKKRCFIEDPPKILVLNLKRFIPINLYGQVRKSEKFVDFQPFLKLAPYLSPIKHDQSTEAFYRLYGVVVHSGISIQSGHYIAYISRDIGDWFFASDSIIRPSSWDEVKRSRPYLLFYERVK